MRKDWFGTCLLWGLETIPSNVFKTLVVLDTVVGVGCRNPENLKISKEKPSINLSPPFIKKKKISNLDNKLNDSYV